jgi:hypothetical protein
MVLRTTDAETGLLVDMGSWIGTRLHDRKVATDDSTAIDRLVTGFVKLTRSFSDLDFAGRGGALDLRRRLPSVSRVRIELPKLESLQLATIVIKAEGVSDLRQETTATVSSMVAESREAWQQRLLFDPANTATAVHTKKQQRPWLEIAFDRPVNVTRIFLRNVDDADSGRARGIQVLARSQDHGWTTIYDGWRRERAFSHAVERQSARWIPTRGSAVRADPRCESQPPTKHVIPAVDSASAGAIADLVGILTNIQLRDDAEIRRELASIELPAEDKARFKTRVNRWIAEPELEWNIHGISRTFRFWSEQQKQDYVGFAVDVTDCLRDLTDNVCFGFGSVLAVVRDHDLIPHDDDADVIVGFEPGQASTLAEGRKLIRECLGDHGYTVTAKNRYAHHFVWRRAGGQKLDAFAGIFEGNTISWYPGRRGLLTRDIMFPPSYRPLLGQACPVPQQPETYLEQIYGPDWQTPKPEFRHRWEDAREEYQDIRDRAAPSGPDA